MPSKNHMNSAAVRVIAGICIALANLSCSSPAPAGRQMPEASGAGTANASTSVIWTELLQKNPYPHTAPLPPHKRTVLDGTYTKIDPQKTPAVPCRRCPDYVPAGGVWKLQFSNGVYRIFHKLTGWRSIGSFLVDGNRVKLFNDPTCIEVTGTYTWTLTAGRLNWVVVQDECAIGMRAKNFTRQLWLSCQPPSMETDRLKAPGCD